MDNTVHAEAGQTPAPRPEVVGAAQVDSVALRRVMDQVRNGQAAPTTSYSRMHNRHNRS